MPAHTQNIRPFIVIAASAMIAKMVMVWTGWCEGTIIADDAYYYFTIASNMASGAGPTFDGLAATNGYHPLWLMLLVPVYSLFPESLWIPVRISLSVCALLDIVSGYIIYRIFERAGHHVGGIIASALWLLGPLTFFLGLRGMEGSLSSVIVLGIAASVARLGSRDNPFGHRSALWTGLLIGLAGLARTDNLISVGFAICAVVALAVLAYRKSVGQVLKWFTIVASSSLLVVLPWLAWNLSRFGSIVQVSGQVKYHSSKIYGGLYWDWSSLYWGFKSVAYACFSPLIWPSRFLAGEESSPARVTFGVVIGLLLFIIVPLWRARGKLAKTLSDSRPGYLVVFSITFMAVHTLVFGWWWRTYAIWYAMPYLALLCMLTGMVWATYLQTDSLRRVLQHPLVWTGLLYGVALSAIFLIREPHIPRRPEIEHNPVLQALSKSYPQGAVVGLFNAGAFGYVARAYPHLTVTNLDCLVNNRAYAAVRSGQYLEYLIETVDVMAENPEIAKMYLDDADVDSLKRVFVKSDKDELWSKQSP